MSVITQVLGAFLLGIFIGGAGLTMIFAFPQINKFLKQLFGGRKRKQKINDIRDWLAQAEHQGIDEVTASLTLINAHKIDPEVVKEAVIKYKKEKLKYGNQESRLQQVSANAGSSEPIFYGSSAGTTGNTGNPRADGRGANGGARDFDFARPGNSQPTDIGEIGQSSSRDEKRKRYFE